MLDTIIKNLKSILADIKENEFANPDLVRIQYYISSLEGLINQQNTKNNLRKEYTEKEHEQKLKSFNSMSASEWAMNSKNVWNDLSSSRQKKHLIHGATYSNKLAERVVTMYSKEGDLVFDPFLGTGTTLHAAKNLNRNGIGIELVKKFYDVAKEDIMHGLFRSKQIVINDDCRNMSKFLEDDSIQLTLTSPPYADFIHKTIKDRTTAHKSSEIVKKNNSKTKPYSDLKEDFGNLDYKTFLKETENILKIIHAKTKQNGYCVWVVKDYRDTKNNTPYISFHSDLVAVGKESGFKFHDLIIWDQNAQRSLILLGYPSVFYTNQNCSFLVVFRKS